MGMAEKFAKTLRFRRDWMVGGGESGRPRLKLVEDALQGADSRRQWVAVVCYRAFHLSREGQLFFVGKVKRHNPDYMG
jgi:hypothetical protein